MIHNDLQSITTTDLKMIYNQLQDDYIYLHNQLACGITR